MNNINNIIYAMNRIKYNCQQDINVAKLKQQYKQFESFKHTYIEIKNLENKNKRGKNI